MIESFSENALEILDLIRELDFKQCGDSAISDWKNCWKGTAAHTGVHLAEAVAAWKVGKIVGQIAGNYMASHYGMDPEMANKLAETFVQGTVATALAFKELKDPQSLTKRLLTEYAAAFVGKTAHAGAEHALSSKEVAEYLKTVAPIAAGKISGISTAIAGSKVPSAGQLSEMIVSRSKADIAKVAAFFSQQAPQVANFAEVDEKAIETMVDLFVVSSIFAIRKNRKAFK